MHDEDEFRAFVRHRWSALVRSAYVLTGDAGHAEDLVQVALERMHRHLQHVDDLDRYARRIMVNEASSRWRSRSRRPETLVEAAPEAIGPDQIAQRDERDRVWRALRRLPPRTRAILVLRFYEDLSEPECAAVLDCSVGSIKSQASRGLAWLRANAGLGTDDPSHLPARGGG